MSSKKTDDTANNDREMQLTDHLEELRRRLIVVAVSIGIATVGSYYFSEDLFRILMAPLLAAMPAEGGLIFTGLTETFFTYLKISLVAGFFIASPVVIFQLWRFTAPGLYAHEKRYVFPFVLSATIFFVGGALFGYFIVFPFGFRFFMGFATDFIRPMPSVKEYFSFAVRMLFAFGVVCTSFEERPCLPHGKFFVYGAAARCVLKRRVFFAKALRCENHPDCETRDAR